MSFQTFDLLLHNRDILRYIFVRGGQKEALNLDVLTFSEWTKKETLVRHFAKYLLLSSTEESKTYRFEMTRWCVNNDKIIIFWMKLSD